MNIQIASDLHLEFHKRQAPGYTGLVPTPGADMLVLAGDIGVWTDGIKAFENWPVPIVYVHGNHEMYAGTDLDRAILDLRETCADLGIHFLENESLLLDQFPGVRFLGACMWTDYRIFGWERQPDAMRECAAVLRDHERIRTLGRQFMPSDALKRHQASAQWLREQLALPFAGATVVVTHHGCGWGSVAVKWKDDLTTPGFSSDLTSLAKQADYWIHGHTHDSHDYRIGKCRVVVNPRGYPARSGSGWENPHFDAALMLSVKHE